MSLAAFTIATLMYLVPGAGVSVHSHMVSAGEATREQCDAELAVILAELPGVVVLYSECAVRAVEVPTDA